MPTGAATIRIKTGVSGSGVVGSPSAVPSSYPTIDEVYPAILAPGTQWTRRLAIFEADGETPWGGTSALLDGQVTVDGGRDERRTVELTLDNQDGQLDSYPGGFWYDKVLKLYRGVTMPDGRSWEGQIGEFTPDDIQSQNFPHRIVVHGRDYTKKLLTSQFPTATAFVKDTPIESVIRAVAANGGITKMQIPVTGKTLGKDFVYEAGTTRWKCISNIAESYGYEVYFDANGYLILRPYLDPVTSAISFTFQTGPQVGNLASFSKKVSDARIYNHIVVTGASSDSSSPPVWAEVKNTEPSSPTNISEFGERTYRYTSPFLSTKDQCLDTAMKFLKIHALEQFEINMTSLVFPWLEANTIVRFLDPDPNPGDPDRYLMTSFAIPVKLGGMSLTANRVTIVG